MRRPQGPLPIRDIHRVAFQRAAEELSALTAKPGLRWRKAPTRQSGIIVFCVAASPEAQKSTTPARGATVEHASLTVIRREHRALSAMLRSILLLLDQHRKHDTLPDFAALRAMLFYVDEFPEKLHHPKESRLLFPKLRGHSAHTDAVLDRLDREHAHGEFAIRELEHSLIGFEMMCETEERDQRRQDFERSVKTYVDFYLDHMKTEESHVLPLAETVLGPEDWAELDAAFLTNLDPLAGSAASAAYKPLFLKILRSLPASIGVGSALEALAGAGPAKFARSRE